MIVVAMKNSFSRDLETSTLYLKRHHYAIIENLLDYHFCSITSWHIAIVEFLSRSAVKFINKLIMSFGITLESSHIQVLLAILINVIIISTSLQVMIETLVNVERITLLFA
jgi:hypothetical protein